MTSTDSILEKFFSGGYIEKDMKAERPIQTSKVGTVGIVIRRQIQKKLKQDLWPEYMCIYQQERYRMCQTL